jgi:hypothetical protein
VSGSLGVLLAFTVQTLRERHQEKLERERTAAILGNEIAAIKVLSTQGAKLSRFVVDEYRKKYEKGELNSWTITDVDLPRTIYDRPSINLTVFEPELAASIAELYRWVGFAAHARKQANEQSARITRIMSNWKPPTHDLTEEQMVHLYTGQFIAFGQSYVANLERLAQFSQATLEELNKIVRIDETKVHGESFPDAPQFNYTTTSGTPKETTE